MARPRILPLPDELARPIARGVQAIEDARPGASNREFLRAFIPLVVDVTGELFGAQTFQKLLRALAPHRAPSSTTVQLELAAYRLRHDTIGNEQEAKSRSSTSERQQPAHPILPVQRPATLHAREDALGMAAELAALQHLEVERLRRRAEEMEAVAEACRRAQELANAEAQAARGELAGTQHAVRELQETVRHLSDALKQTQERAAADNRASLLRVDAVRQETREVEQKLKAAENTIALRDGALRNAHALADSYRRQVNELRLQLEDRHE